MHYAIFAHGYNYLLWCMLCDFRYAVSSPHGGTVAAVPPPFRPSDPALCGSYPL